MVNRYEAHITFQDIEDQLQENILNHYFIIALYKTFRESTIYNNPKSIGTLTYLIKNISDFKPKLQTSVDLEKFKTLSTDTKYEIHTTSLLQILSFSSRFRRFVMKNYLLRPNMVANNIT